MQNNGECWMDNSNNNNYNKHGIVEKDDGAQRQCDWTRPGEGGKWSNAVYKVTCEYLILGGF